MSPVENEWKSKFSFRWADDRRTAGTCTSVFFHHLHSSHFYSVVIITDCHWTGNNKIISIHVRNGKEMSVVQRKIWLQSLSADRTTKPFWSRNPRSERFSLKKKKRERKNNKKKSHCEGQRRDEMLTVSCYIALRSPESAAKTAALMENMTDAFFSNAVPLVSVTFNWRTAGILAPPTPPRSALMYAPFMWSVISGNNVATFSIQNLHD